MLRLEIAQRIALAAGRKPPRVEDFIDRVLARAGLSRSERRKLIADLKAEASTEKQKETAP